MAEDDGPQPLDRPRRSGADLAFHPGEVCPPDGLQLGHWRQAGAAGPEEGDTMMNEHLSRQNVLTLKTDPSILLCIVMGLVRNGKRVNREAIGLMGVGKVHLTV